jgi:hypothetical protein
MKLEFLDSNKNPITIEKSRHKESAIILMTKSSSIYITQEQMKLIIEELAYFADTGVFSNMPLPEGIDPPEDQLFGFEDYGK